MPRSTWGLSFGRRTLAGSFTETEALPDDLGFVIGAQVGLWNFARNGHLNVWLRYASGLAAYDELGTPSGLNDDRRSVDAQEYRAALAGNVELGHVTFRQPSDLDDVEIDGGTSGGRFNTGLHSGTQYITAASRTISASNFTVPISRQFYLFDSLDAAGNTWNTAYALDSLLEQGLGAEMLDIGGGEIGVAYRGSHNGNSKILKWQVTAQNP